MSTITALPRPTTTSRDLQILKTIAEALNGVADVDQALRTTLDQVARLLGLDTGWIWLLDARSGRYYSAVAQRLPPFLQEPVRMTGTACWCLRAFAGGELEPGNVDVMECSRLRAAIGRERRETRGLRYHASIPLYFGGRPLGIMNVAAPAWRKLTARELDLLSTIASQVGVAIERARLASASVVAARVEERAKLARELHDTLAQRLTAIGLHLEAAIDAVPPETPATASLQRALELSRGGLEEARRSMRELRLPQGSLADAVEALARGFAAETGVRVHVSAAASAALAPSGELEIYRIAGEALTNVQKHAHATDVDLTLSVTPAHLLLVIADNGRGFNPRSRTTGFGLLGMRERAQALGARFRVTSRRGHGTRIELTLPARTGR